ncbi:MAG TPA: hypothetical protein VNQ99_13485 [Xanthobacteraceae bacterium]|nr:hypothetical protein [Xanthobacteraceae bacterium]
MSRAQIARRIEASLTKALLLAQQHQLGDIAYLIQMSLNATGREIETAEDQTRFSSDHSQSRMQ